MKALPWSHSSLENFKNCPKQYYHLKILKDVKDNPGEAAMWGDRVHKEFEAYLKADALTNEMEVKAKILPEELHTYLPYLTDIKNLPGVLYVEQQLSLNRDMLPCEWDAPDVWCRGIVDVLVIDGERAVVLDHKTGKNRKPSSRQLMLFALLVFAHYPEVNVCKTSFAWLKFKDSPKGYTDTEIFRRPEIPMMWQQFIPDLNMFVWAFKNEKFMPRQSGLCNGWCSVESCENWKPKR